MDKIQQYLANHNYYDLYANSDLFEEYIQSLTVDDALKIAIALNKLLRNKENEDVVANDMIAGELTAPTSDIRSMIIENLLNTLKKISDNRLRAELVYYTFINLHMFSDGNGRTARLMFGLITGQLENEEWYIHSDDSMHKYDGDFCSYMNMLDESQMNYNANSMLSQVVGEYLIKYPLLSPKIIYRTYSKGMHAMSVSIDEIISEDMKNQLTTDEKNKISLILDDNENNYSVAGLTMLIISAANGQLNEWIRRNDENVEQAFQNGYGEQWMRNRLSFNLIKSKDLLLKWQLEDWKKVIQIGNELKLMQFNYLNEIYCNLANKEKKQESTDMLKR